ncbi:MAG: DUF4301 family protein [Marinifilaceae bacterium]|jgi:hypothetical protein|nr:DUF4301 family protein [Marinifilaceae bacterium]
MFTKNIIDQLKENNISEEKITEQINKFKKGFNALELESSARINSGIIKLTKSELKEYTEKSESIENKSICKFVPASGAATRMFKPLYDFLNEYKNTESEYLDFLKDKSENSLFRFFNNIEDFAFYEDLHIKTTDIGEDLEKLISKNNYNKILEILLSDYGLNYGKLPKGLLKFHKYHYRSRTAFEEHIVEAFQYCTNKDKTANLHLTVSPEHHDLFLQKWKEVKDIMSEKYKYELNLEFSFQQDSTQTLAVDQNNKPILDDKKRLILRPAGHGALINNLNELKYAYVYIKNIDNVSPDSLKPDTVVYKKALLGILQEKQNKVFEYLNLLEQDNTNDNLLFEIVKFIEENLGTRLNFDYKEIQIKKLKTELFNILNRPIRVCGVVKNQGEPGGGPFWVKNESGKYTSLQIVESAQVDTANEEQNNIFKNSTHFNPVDIVCGLYNYKGEKFKLYDFVDHNTGFITEKSHQGQSIKAMELPGLWNGAMANWNTIFVEVPNTTFNPVKNVFDLLRIEHSNYCYSALE